MRICTKCAAPVECPTQPYCNACHAAYMRAWRKSHPLTGESRRRSNARAYLHVYERRGKIKRQPCADCGNPHVEPDHLDYSRPLLVVWRCVPCHLARHGKTQRVPVARRPASVLQSP